MSLRARTGAVVLALAAVGAGAGGGEACSSSPRPAGAPLALVLSGGGAKGAYEAGVTAALVEAGVPLRLVAGSSAGALNAAMIAADPTPAGLERLEAAWRGMSRDQVYGLRPAVFFSGLLPGWLTLLAVDRVGALLDPAPLRARIEAGLDLARVRASPVAVAVVAADLERRRLRVFDNGSLSVDVLMAAAAMPGVFPAVRVDGAWLADGGLVGRAPVLEALGQPVAVERVLVVLSYAEAEQGPAPTTARRALEGAFEMAMAHQIRRDVELARLRHPGIDVQLLVPSAPLDLRPLDFEPEAIGAAIARGRADGRACLEAWRGGRDPR
jgi:NTE family protein